MSKLDSIPNWVVWEAAEESANAAMKQVAYNLIKRELRKERDKIRQGKLSKDSPILPQARERATEWLRNAIHNACTH